MAIISGGRLNIWNAVKKQFEVVHPETEVARITDFADGIVQKLALTSAMTAVTALQADSWFGKLLKMALTASGVKYSIAQNGYVCLGDLFGGLIIQWGTVSVATNNQQGSHYASGALPVTVNTFLQGLASYDWPRAISFPVTSISYEKNTIIVGAQLLPGYTGDPVNIRWLGLFK